MESSFPAPYRWCLHLKVEKTEMSWLQKESFYFELKFSPLSFLVFGLRRQEVRDNGLWQAVDTYFLSTWLLTRWPFAWIVSWVMAQSIGRAWCCVSHLPIFLPFHLVGFSNVSQGVWKPSLQISLTNQDTCCGVGLSRSLTSCDLWGYHRELFVSFLSSNTSSLIFASHMVF